MSRVPYESRCQAVEASRHHSRAEAGLTRLLCYSLWASLVAGFGVAPAGAEESSIEQARSIFETNFFGIVRTTRAVVPYMRKQGGGRIINIGSVLEAAFL